MKKFMSMIIVMCLVMSLLAGCGKKQDNTQEQPQKTTTGEESGEKDTTKDAAATEADGTENIMDALYAQIAEKNVEIELWTGPDWKGVYDSSVEGADYLDFFNSVKKDFEAKYPNIKVNLSLIDGSQRSEKLSIAIQSDTLPNMYYESDFALSDYVHEGLMVPIDDIISEEDKSDIPQAVWDGLALGGKTYIFPFSAEVGLMGINVSIFEKAGATDLLPEGDIGVWTPEQFKAALKAVSGIEGVYPFAVFANSQQGDSYTNMLLRMYGGKFVNDEGSAFTINDEKGVKALQFIADLNSEGLLAPGGETLSQGDVYQMFLNKNLAVATMSNLTYNDLVAGLKNGSIEQPFDFKWAYYPNETGSADPYCLSYVKG